MWSAVEESLRSWLTPIIAFIALWIAYQQHKNTKTKIKLDLFERRIGIYESAQAFLGIIIREAYVDTDRLIRFRQDCWHARFLFGKEVNAEFDAIFQRANELSARSRQNRADVWEGRENEKEESLQKETELLLWLSDRGKSLDLVVAPYLSFDKIKT